MYRRFRFTAHTHIKRRKCRPGQPPFPPSPYSICSASNYAPDLIVSAKSARRANALDGGKSTRGTRSGSLRRCLPGGAAEHRKRPPLACRKPRAFARKCGQGTRSQTEASLRNGRVPALLAAKEIFLIASSFRSSHSVELTIIHYAE